MTATVPPPLRAAAGPDGDRLFSAWAKATACAAFFLLFAGGMVTSTGSGLAVPDWPLSYGTLNPPMVGGIFFEHGHRLVAGAVALLALVLAVLAGRAGVPRGAAAGARLAAFGIVLQALLGGLTVLLRLPPAVSIAHALLGQAVFCVLLASATLASAWYRALPALGQGSVPAGWAWLGLGAGFIQLGLGARLRHGGELGALIAHGMGAALVFLIGAMAARAAWRDPAGLRGPAALLSLALPLQLALGVLAWRLRADATLSMGFRASALWRSAHLSGGALTLAAFLVLALAGTRSSEPA